MAWIEHAAPLVDAHVRHRSAVTKTTTLRARIIGIVPVGLPKTKVNCLCLVAIADIIVNHWRDNYYWHGDRVGIPMTCTPRHADSMRTLFWATTTVTFAL